MRNNGSRRTGGRSAGKCQLASFFLFPSFRVQPSLSIPDSTASNDASPEDGPRKQNLDPSDQWQMCSSGKRLNDEGGKALSAQDVSPSVADPCGQPRTDSDDLWLPILPRLLHEVLATSQPLRSARASSCCSLLVLSLPSPSPPEGTPEGPHFRAADPALAKSPTQGRRKGG